jgi:hypothetical protein
MSTQICNKCNIPLPIENFQKLKSGKGHYKKCITCNKSKSIKEEKYKLTMTQLGNLINEKNKGIMSIEDKQSISALAQQLLDELKIN